MSAAAFIPTIGRSPVLHGLIEALVADDCHEILIGDNGMPSLVRSELDQFLTDLGDERVVVHDLMGYGIYSMWNAAISRGRSLADPRVAVLNDDIVIPAGFIAGLHDALVADYKLALACPNHLRGLEDGVEALGVEYVEGSFRQGGVCGFAFMVDSVKCPSIDNRFQVWYGDDDLVWKIHEAKWRCGRVVGLPLAHLQSLSVNSAPWVPEAIIADQALWDSLGRS